MYIVILYFYQIHIEIVNLVLIINADALHSNAINYYLLS